MGAKREWLDRCLDLKLFNNDNESIRYYMNKYIGLYELCKLELIRIFSWKYPLDVINYDINKDLYSKADLLNDGPEYAIDEWSKDLFNFSLYGKKFHIEDFIDQSNNNVYNPKYERLILSFITYSFITNKFRDKRNILDMFIKQIRDIHRSLSTEELFTAFFIAKFLKKSTSGSDILTSIINKRGLDLDSIIEQLSIRINSLIEIYSEVLLEYRLLRLNDLANKESLASINTWLDKLLSATDINKYYNLYMTLKCLDYGKPVIEEPVDFSYVLKDSGTQINITSSFNYYSFNPNQYAVYYLVAEDDLANPIIENTVSTSPTSHIMIINQDLDTSKTYYLYCRYYASNGIVSARSEYIELRPIEHIIEVPFNIYPYNNASISPIDNEIVFTVSDYVNNFNNEMELLEIEISDTSDMSNIIINQTNTEENATTITVNHLWESNIDYYYRIRYKDKNSNYSEYSGITRFTIV